MSLLIVAENLPMRRLIRSLVQDLFDVINECSDATKAFYLYCEDRPDWLVIDAELKAINGIELARDIKTKLPEAKIVLMLDFDDAKFHVPGCALVLKDNLYEIRNILVRAN